MYSFKKFKRIQHKEKRTKNNNARNGYLKVSIAYLVSFSEYLEYQNLYQNTISKIDKRISVGTQKYKCVVKITEFVIFIKTVGNF